MTYRPYTLEAVIDNSLLHSKRDRQTNRTQTDRERQRQRQRAAGRERDKKQRDKIGEKYKDKDIEKDTARDRIEKIGCIVAYANASPPMRRRVYESVNILEGTRSIRS